MMRSVKEIRERYNTTDCPITEDILTWVLAENLKDCPFCDHPQRRSLELRLSRDEMTVAFLEAKMNWPPMTIYDHIQNHMEYNAEEAALVENIRSETISTLKVYPIWVCWKVIPSACIASHNGLKSSRSSGFAVSLRLEPLNFLSGILTPSSVTLKLTSLIRFLHTKVCIQYYGCFERG